MIATLTNMGHYYDGNLYFESGPAYVGTGANGSIRSWLHFSLDTEIGVNDTIDSATMTLRFSGGTGTRSMRVVAVKEAAPAAPVDVSAALDDVNNLTSLVSAPLLSNVLTSETDRTFDISAVLSGIRAAIAAPISSILFYVVPSTGASDTYMQLKDLSGFYPYSGISLAVTPAPPAATAGRMGSGKANRRLIPG